MDGGDGNVRGADREVCISVRGRRVHRRPSCQEIEVRRALGARGGPEISRILGDGSR